MAIVSYSYSSVNETFFQALKESFSACRSTRKCPGLSDLELLKLSVRRVLSQAQSGRDFLQQAHEIEEFKVGRSNFFEALKSQRRGRVALEANSRLCEIVSRELPDSLEHVSEMKDFAIYAGDGHWHAASAHDECLEGKKYATGHFFVLNLRTSCLNHLSHAQGKKEHDMHALKRLGPELLRQGAPVGQKVLYVWDRGGIEFLTWDMWKWNHGVYFLSREKSNMKLEVLGHNQFSRKDPRNRGILSDEIVGTSQGTQLRRIVYQNPETNVIYCFITNLSSKIPPGVVAHLYKCRWDIEKSVTTHPF